MKMDTTLSAGVAGAYVLGCRNPDDRPKAASNVRKHGVRFDEASTALGDPVALLMPDPDHSLGEERYILLGMSSWQKLLVVTFAEQPPRTRLISARRPRDGSRRALKKKASHRNRKDKRDTMRPEYDFSAAVRGVTAAR